MTIPAVLASVLGHLTFRWVCRCSLYSFSSTYPAIGSIDKTSRKMKQLTSHCGARRHADVLPVHLVASGAAPASV
ncbi:hypothetical protein BC827DRAFT_1231461 [Russula dissimulans]|nr:hypothetical protein BC827DRAFT_1231461 [Russula dissimulans]